MAVAVAAVEEATEARWRLVVLLALFLVRLEESRVVGIGASKRRTADLAREARSASDLAA